MRVFGTKVDLSAVVAWGLWGVAVVFVFSGTLVGLETEQTGVTIALMAHGLMFSAAAAAATVRHVLLSQVHLLSELYELGKDSAGVRQMRGAGR